MKRLFVFGCSFTKWCWPTWADFLSLGYDEYYNFGQCGAGNRFIFERLIEASMTYDFGPTDTIVIMWSSYQRHDLFKDGEWFTPGNVLNGEPIFDDDYVRKYFDIEGSVLHTLNYIRAAQEVLGGWDVDWYMASMRSLLDPLSETNHLFEIVTSPRTQSIFTEFPNLLKYGPIFKHDKWLNVSITGYINQFYAADEFVGFDLHPTPTMHLSWLTEVAKSHNGMLPNENAQTLLKDWTQHFSDFAGIEILNEEGYKWVEENIPCNGLQ